jgi:carbon-monoxide dehydrogenase catalytic subunit
VDNSRILIAASEMVRVGGLGDSIADLPAAGAAPEWMSEKAISIGQYFVASGFTPYLAPPSPSLKRPSSTSCLFDGLEEQGLGKWGFTRRSLRDGRMMIAHIDKKRKALGIDKARDRVLMDMSDRRDIDAA